MTGKTIPSMEFILNADGETVLGILAMCTSSYLMPTSKRLHDSQKRALKRWNFQMSRRDIPP